MNIKTEALIGIFIVAAICSFLYMSVQLGAFRFDLSRYVPYNARFSDVAGLQKKADIKIAGVKVGWVDSVTLQPDNTVLARLMVLRDYTLYKNAYAIVRQEGMLGLKFLELVPGDSNQEPLRKGETFEQQGRQFVSLDEILYSFSKIAKSVQELSQSLKDTTQEVKDIAIQLKHNINPVAQTIHDMKDQMNTNIHKLVNGVESTCNSLKKTTTMINEQIYKVSPSIQAGSEVIHKINNGTGVLGKLVHDEAMYDDVKQSVTKVCNSVESIAQWSFAVDSYIEPLIGLNSHIKPHVKGYLDFYFFPRRDLFFLAGAAFSDDGFANKTITNLTDCNGHKTQTYAKQKQSSVTADVQVGKIFKNWAFRLGLFEGSLGFGVDWKVPLERVNLISSFQAFDFRGHHRIGYDRRPHLKFLNRLFLSPSFYITFGAEDFISKCNKSLFLGAGLWFNDSELRRYCCF